jgi:hypothetical protein
MAKSADRPDDNELQRLGAFRGYFDGVELATVEADVLRSSRASLLVLISAAEASARMAEAMRSTAPLIVLRSTPGAGKSREVRNVVKEHAEQNGRALLFVPTHALGAQTAGEFSQLGVTASAPMSVARVHLTVINDQGEEAHGLACEHATAADLLIRSGVRVRQDMCAHCDHRDNHRGGGERCPAYDAGGASGAVAVLQHPVLAAALAEHTRRLLSSEPPKGPAGRPATLVVVDELPPLTTATRLDGARAEYRRLRAGEMREITREGLEPLLVPLLAGADAATVRGLDGASVRELLTLAGLGPDDIHERLAAAREVDGAPLWTPGLEANLARLAVQQPANVDMRRKLERLARLTALCEAIVDAACDPDAPALRVDVGGPHLVTRARWTRRVLPYVQAGGRLRLLDATAPLDALRALWGDALEVVQVDVHDATGVERRHVQWQHGARRRHSARVDGATLPAAAEVRGPLRTVATAAAERGARTVALLTDKPLADGLRAWLADRAAGDGGATPAMVPAELSAFVDGGGMLHVGHFGAQRGLDTWAGCDLVVTLGDPWPDLGAARAEALALGLAPDEHALDLARAELLQAWGRARTVHRQTPVLVLHLGSRKLAPDASWAPQWVAVQTEEPPPHRPRSVQPATDPATWKADRQAQGLTARQHAAALGLSWGTYCRLGAEALRRPPVEPRNELSEIPAEKGSTEVAQNSAQDLFQYGSSEGREAPSLIPSSGPLETPMNLGVDGCAPDPGGCPVQPPPSRRTRPGVTVALAPPVARTSAPSATDPPARGGFLVA